MNLELRKLDERVLSIVSVQEDRELTIALTRLQLLLLLHYRLSFDECMDVGHS